MTRETGGGRDHVLLGDPALDEPVRVRELERAHAAVGGEIGVEDDEVVAFGSEPDELVAVGVDHVLVRDLRRGALPAPDSGSPSSVSERRLRRRRATGSSSSGPRPSGREPLADAPDELGERALERLVVGSARVPAIRPASLAQRLPGAP